MHGVPFWGDGNVWERDGGDVCTRRTHRTSPAVNWELGVFHRDQQTSCKIRSSLLRAGSGMLTLLLRVLFSVDFRNTLLVVSQPQDWGQRGQCLSGVHGMSHSIIPDAGKPAFSAVDRCASYQGRAPPLVPAGPCPANDRLKGHPADRTECMEAQPGCVAGRLWMQEVYLQESCVWLESTLFRQSATDPRGTAGRGDGPQDTRRQKHTVRCQQFSVGILPGVRESQLMPRMGTREVPPLALLSPCKPRRSPLFCMEVAPSGNILLTVPFPPPFHGRRVPSGLLQVSTTTVYVLAPGHWTTALRAVLTSLGAWPAAALWEHGDTRVRRASTAHLRSNPVGRRRP